MAGEDFWEFKASQQRIFLVLRPESTEANHLVARLYQEDRTDPKKSIGNRPSDVSRSTARTERQMKGEAVIKEWSRQYRGDPEFEFDLLAIEIGERIVERMEELGMTRTKLAAAVGVSKARISQVLSGYDNLTLKSLVAVATGLESRVELRLKSKEIDTKSARPRWRPIDADVRLATAGDPPESAVAA